MKKLYYLCLLLLACSSSVWAARPGVTFLFTDGNKASFAFEDDPKLTLTSTGFIISVAGQDDASYEFSDIHSYYFEEDIHTAIERVDAGVAVSGASNPLFSCVGGIVSVSGMKAGERLSVVSMNGASVASAVADRQGNTSVDLTSASAGVYVLSVEGGVSFKWIKK